MSLRDRLLPDDIVNEQTTTGVPKDGWPTLFLFAQEACEQYEAYVKAHVATKTDPLRTYSGWLQSTGIEIVDSGWGV